MDQKEKAKEASAKAKEAFLKKDFPTAIKGYTEAIQFDPTDHLLFSNRSACYASLEQYEDALDDAVKCIELKPDFARGYGRKGLALFYLKKYKEAEEVYQTGLQFDPNNSQLKDGLASVQNKLKEQTHPGPGPQAQGSPFGSPQEILQKLMNDPVTKEYFKDQDFIQKLQLCQANPQMLFSLMQQDPRFSKVFSVITGINMDDLKQAQAQQHQSAEEQKRKDEEMADFKAKQAKEQKEKEREEAMTPEQLEEYQAKKKADECKNQGNAYYKNKDLQNALNSYDQAIQLYPKEPFYYLNKASVYLEQKQYEDCLAVCDKAIELAESQFPRPLEKIAKGYSRKGNCYLQMEKFDEAIEMYDKSLLECNDQQIKDLKKKLIEMKKKKEEEAYIDPAKAEEHKEKGNKFFRDGNFIEAIKEYDEAVKRNPSSAVIFLNRALSLMKIMDYAKALADIEKSLKLDPTYAKAYAKKGNIHFYLKEYHKALEAYEKGLKIDPTFQECKDGLIKTQTAVYSSEPDEERAKRAMEDPEIRAILQDPRIQQVLKEAREGQNTVGAAMNDPFISQSIQKLIAAGIVKVGK